MRLNCLRMRQFRNHINSAFEFSTSTNIFLGENGQGKTNVLEAISYLCLTKSFFASSDSLIPNNGAPAFEVEGTVISDSDSRYDIRVTYLEHQKEKSFTINRQKAFPFSTVIGKFPIVICSPEHAPITFAGPQQRRKFIDFVVSQSDRSYFKNLIEYKRILQQRNRILIEGKTMKRETFSLLKPWNEQLVEKGSYLTLKRKQFTEEFGEYMETAYFHISESDGKPSIDYSPSYIETGDIRNGKINEKFRSALEETGKEELRLGSTLVGPHRDELLLAIDGRDLRKYASQGQHKTFLVALKAAEFFYLKERCNDTPIFLLDDIFSELDESRSKRLMDYILPLSQTFITSTNPRLFTADTVPGADIRKFILSGGKVIDRSACTA